MRRSQPLHPSALLVDQDRGISRTRSRSQFRNECSNLSRRLNIALEEDEAPWAFAADKLPLYGGQFRSGYARNEGPRAHNGRLTLTREGVKETAVNSSG
ncbi:hypothetical protein ACVWWR_007460 [Bradyrhizobium sp. LM3.2]